MIARRAEEMAPFMVMEVLERAREMANAVTQQLLPVKLWAVSPSARATLPAP